MCKMDDNTECDSFWIIIYAEYVQLKVRHNQNREDLNEENKGHHGLHDILENELLQDVTNCIFHGFTINHIF